MLKQIHGNVGVDLFYYKSKDDGHMYYSPLLTFFFDDDGSEHFTIPTDIHSRDKMEALQICFEHLGHMFTEIAAVVNVINATNLELIESINMNKVKPEEEELPSFMVDPEPEAKQYLH